MDKRPKKAKENGEKTNRSRFSKEKSVLQSPYDLPISNGLDRISR